jgi:recombination protein RecT
VSVKVLKPADALRGELSRMESQFKAALPPQITVEKFMRVVMTAVQGNPELLNANRQSLYQACMHSAQDGLLPDGREAALVIYKISGEPTARYMIMVGGILKKIRNSGELSSITAQVVYANDEFDYWLDEVGEHIKHRPLLDGERGGRRLCYAVARTKDDGLYTEFMTTKQVEEVKNSSRAKNSGPWSGPFEDEMWRKTVIRRLSKRLPMSTDLEAAIKSDDDLHDFGKTETPATETPKAASRLAKIVEARAEEIASARTEGVDVGS